MRTGTSKVFQVFWKGVIFGVISLFFLWRNKENDSIDKMALSIVCPFSQFHMLNGLELLTLFRH